MDVPLYYHYMFNVHVGMAGRTFDIPLILVASRLAIVFHAFLFLLTLYAFCESRFQAGWLGAVSAAQMLLTFGIACHVARLSSRDSLDHVSRGIDDGRVSDLSRAVR